MKLQLSIAAAVLGTALVTPAVARDQFRIVGSSTVYPFTTAVAENFGKASGKTPVVDRRVRVAVLKYSVKASARTRLT